MAEYKGIKGFKVQYLSADPSDPNIGQTWYNSTSKDLKYTEFQAAAWSSGTNLPVAVDQGGGVGTQTTALQFAGLPPPKVLLAVFILLPVAQEPGARSVNFKSFEVSLYQV